MERTQSSAFDVSPPSHVTVRDALQALTAINQDTLLLNYGNVVIRRGYQDLKTVRLISGGVAGTDLSHAIFVGKGMLTAAILGEHAVPSSREILHTIKEVNEGEKSGILIIVQANADVFNFELAVLRANEDCKTRVKLLVIDDDKSEVKERYSCGFILLTKILGAMAEEGAVFDDIYRFYEGVVHNIITVPLKYLQIGEYNLRISPDFDNQCRQAIHISPKYSLELQPSVPVVALINTSRTLNRLNELGLVKQVIDKLRGWDVPISRMYYGSFLTAAPQTASLTIIKATDTRIVKYLDAATDASGWKRVTQFMPEVSAHNEIPGILQNKGKKPIICKGPKLGPPQILVLEKSLQFACDALFSCERQLNTIDSEKSGGNVGTRFRKLAEGLNRKLTNHKLPTDCPYAFFKKLAIISESLGGAMGSIYGVLFDSAANMFGDLPDVEYVTPFVWARALTFGVNCLRSFCLQEEGEMSMFYPLRCCEKAISKEIARDQHFLHCFGVGVSMAEEAAQKTKRNSQHPDAGAHAVGIWMRAAFEAVKLMSNGVENDL